MKTRATALLASAAARAALPLAAALAAVEACGPPTSPAPTTPMAVGVDAAGAPYAPDAALGAVSTPTSFAPPVYPTQESYAPAVFFCNPPVDEAALDAGRHVEAPVVIAQCPKGKGVPVRVDPSRLQQPTLESAAAVLDALCVDEASIQGAMPSGWNRLPHQPPPDAGLKPGVYAPDRRPLDFKREVVARVRLEGAWPVEHVPLTEVGDTLWLRGGIPGCSGMPPPPPIVVLVVIPKNRQIKTQTCGWSGGPPCMLP